MDFFSVMELTIIQFNSLCNSIGMITKGENDNGDNQPESKGLTGEAGFRLAQTMFKKGNR